jgi:hypothetical protein
VTHAGSRGRRLSDLFRRAVRSMREGLGEDGAAVLDRNAADLLGL